MVHGLLADEGGEFFVQRAYCLPEARPDGTPWSREDVAYHEWHAAFGVGLGLGLFSVGGSALRVDQL